jgi:hypothetical protein
MVKGELGPVHGHVHDRVPAPARPSSCHRQGAERLCEGQGATVSKFGTEARAGSAGMAKLGLEGRDKVINLIKIAKIIGWAG